MGFSVTAANVIFGIAILTAASAATSAYWKSQTAVEDARREMIDRAVDAAQTNITITQWQWDAGETTLTFTIENRGTTVLDHTRLTYLIDGDLTFASQEAGYPRLNGVGPAPSALLLPGDELECRFALASEPDTLQVVAENGIAARYAG